MFSEPDGNSSSSRSTSQRPASIAARSSISGPPGVARTSPIWVSLDRSPGLAALVEQQVEQRDAR